MRERFSFLIAEICSGDLFVQKVAMECAKFFPASANLRGKEITMSESLPKLHSVAATAVHLGVSLKTMWRLINSRQISFIKINRRVLISTDAMNEFIQANTITKLDPDDIARNFVYR
jgi:excisionase family DNA binding protein